MKEIHIPSCGIRYWLVLSIASILGCNTGDAFASIFGFVSGLPLLALFFIAITRLERRDQEPRQTYYWLAIVVVRTAATILADLASHVVGIETAILLLTLALLAVLALAKLSSNACPASISGKSQLPPVNAWYWTTMLIAGTLGTTIGDFSSFRSGLGLPLASVSLSTIVLAVLVIGSTGLLAFYIYYWFTVVGVRAAGTSVGDLVAKSIGLAPSALAMSIVLALALSTRMTRVGGLAKRRLTAAGQCKTPDA